MRPRFTLMVLYLFAFFFLYCFLLVAPVLWEVLTSMPPGAEQEEAARVAAKETIQPRLWIAVVAAVMTAGVGISRGLLPGTR